MTYVDAWVKANELLRDGKSAYIVVSRIDGFYVATCGEEIGGGQVVQFVAAGPYQAINLQFSDCAGRA